MGAHEDTGLQINLFEPSSERGLFQIGQNMVIFPLHTVTFPWYFVLFMRSAFKQQGFFQNFYPRGHNFGCSKFRGCRFHNLYVLYVRILSRREKIIDCGIQYNSAIQLLLATSSLLDLHTRNIIQAQMSNDFRGTRPLVNLRSLENISRKENTVPTPVTCKLKNLNRSLVGRRR